ncbi:MAG: 4Fe-4S binding protein [Lachnospiraceae bacterium]|nr:4Fe-4S binding protein [Lachnospiraceae bacterium]
MKLRSVKAVFFSPTGMTRKVTEFMARQIADRCGVPCESVDFTLPAAREKKYAFDGEELVVFGCPTYAGKLPNKILPFVQTGFSGNGAFAVAVQTFGNRSVDNAVAESAKCLADNGFRVLAGASVVTRHCFSNVIAQDRPDEADWEAMKAFCAQVCEKADRYASAQSIPLPPVPGDADAPYYRPKGVNGEPTNFLKAKPKTDPALCDHCMRCVKACPMGSIDAEDPALVTGICIKCHACVRVCPKGAKYFDDPVMLSHKGMLERDLQRRAKTEFFI